MGKKSTPATRARPSPRAACTARAADAARAAAWARWRAPRFRDACQRCGCYRWAHGGGFSCPEFVERLGRSRRVLRAAWFAARNPRLVVGVARHRLREWSSR